MTVPAQRTSSPAPGRSAFRQLLAGDGPAALGAAAATVIVEMAVYVLARALGAPLALAALAALAACTVWVALASAAWAAAAKATLGALLRGGVVADASGVTLLVLAGISPHVTLLAALKVYCALAATALFAIALVCCGSRRPGRCGAAVAAACVLAAALGTPLWTGGLLALGGQEAKQAAVAWAVYANPFYSVTAAVVERTRFVWHQAPVMYNITRIGDYASPPPTPWWAAAAIYAGAACVIAAAKLLISRLRRSSPGRPIRGT